MKKSLLGSVAVSFIVLSPAFAADMPLKAPRPAPVAAAPNWTGIYFGANGGYGWGRADLTFPTAQFFADVAGQGYSQRPDGGIVGGHAGINWQIGPWVIGEETMIDWSRLDETRIGGVSPTFPADIYSTRISRYDSETARLGYAFGNFLFYAKGGVAWARWGLDLFSGPPIPNVAASYRQTVVGATGGGGIEYMVVPNLILGIEYDYAAFKDRGIYAQGACIGAGCAATLSAPVTINATNTNISTVLGRVSYLINWGSLGF